MPAVLILTGATASGKTRLALDLARDFDAEIVGADSRQIYAGMPIGTAAPTPAERAIVPHHLVEFLDPRERYSAARFAEDALIAIDAIHARGKRAIVVGGTGFYVRALCGDVALAPEHDADLRARLAREGTLHEPQFLHDWLSLRDPARAAALFSGDTYRVLRALEVALSATGTAQPRTLATLRSRKIPHIKLFLDVPTHELDARIERRVDQMIQDGLLEEAERVGPDAVAASAVGYSQALAYLHGECTHDEFRELLRRATRRYARRQRTWFRSEPDTLWVGADAVATVAREKLDWV